MRFITGGLFILFEASILLTKVYIKATVINNNNLDCYGHTNNSFHFCKSCYSMIVKKKYQNFDCINVLPCQKYFDILSNLTFIKKVFIACAYSIMFVIKLIPSKTSLTVES